MLCARKDPISGKTHLSNMTIQIMIPLTGNGTRFVEAGYQRLKPFIHVHGYPLIHWVSKLFPGDDNHITFICRADHLDAYPYMRKELLEAAPHAKIVVIKDWTKEGPVPNCLKALDHIDETAPLLISYCDYYMHWDYAQFKKQIQENNCDGAIPCYSGFHPHLIHKNNL